MPARKLASKVSAPEPRIARSQKVAADTNVSAASVFGDSEWEMWSAATPPGARHTSWDFSTVPTFPGGFALALAEYAFHRLHKPVASHDRAGAWSTVHNELVCLRTFAEFCVEGGCGSFAEVDAELCDDFLRSLKKARKTDDRIRTILSAIYRLWEYSEALSEPIREIPFGRPLEKLVKKRSGKDGMSENRTPVIPEAIYGPLMATALDYVLNYGATIIAARNELRSAWERESRRLTTRSRTTKYRVLTKLTEEITDRVRAPWLSESWRGQNGIFRELQQLRRACIIVTLAYSGIRSSELLSLEARCCVNEDAGGGRVRHYVNTTVRKHRGVGSKDTWVVIEEVVQAIKLLEDLTDEARRASFSDKLFLSTSGRFTIVGESRHRVRSEVLTYEGVLAQIKAFIGQCNEFLDSPQIPAWQDDVRDSRGWDLTMRQFRRTLARYIARQPFGVIAGMLQYKHVEIACFEGYAGTDPEWNKMLAEEKVLASVNVLDELAIDLSHGTVAGQTAERLQAEFQQVFKGRAEDYPPSEIARWLANRRNNLFIGKFNFCFFNEEKALCTTHSDRKDVPILNSCDPEHCSNACVGKRHAPLWQAQLDQAIEMMKHPKASEFQRTALKAEVQHLTSVVSAVAGSAHV